MITLALYCHNFQKRLCWMLSSLLDQTVKPRVVVSCMQDNGTPKTEDVVGLFRDQLGMDIELDPYNDITVFEQRGIVRNNQLESCKTEWLLFADCDMVYHPAFFESLYGRLDEFPHDAVICSGRKSCHDVAIQDIDKLVNENVKTKPVYVVGSFDKIIPMTPVRRACGGAGFFQLIHVDAADGYYVQSAIDHGWLDGGIWKTYSDHVFRRRVGKLHNLPRWFWRNQRHVNHFRDNQFDKHLDDQR